MQTDLPTTGDHPEYWQEGGSGRLDKVEMDPSPLYMGRVRIDATNYHKIPVPPLRNSTPQAVPQSFGARSAVASYTPPTNDGSKYSAARVKERMGTDGTVRTVQEPKKTPEGLYVRPAGRKRKGMEWDAVRGIWVPE